MFKTRGGGGGQRPFEQCSKKHPKWYPGTSLTLLLTLTLTCTVVGAQWAAGCSAPPRPPVTRCRGKLRPGPEGGSSRSWNPTAPRFHCCFLYEYTGTPDRSSRDGLESQCDPNYNTNSKLLNVVPVFLVTSPYFTVRAHWKYVMWCFPSCSITNQCP